MNDPVEVATANTTHSIIKRAAGSVGSSSEVINIFLSPSVFFIYVLPPIIFDAGFTMPRAKFVENIRDIIIYAFLGTIINSFLTGYGLYGIYKTIGFNIVGRNGSGIGAPEFLLFGSIISAVDPVAVIQDLYN